MISSNSKTIIGVCGYGYTGSGAVIDLLSECDDVYIFDKEKEFSLTYAPDGIEDLEYHLVEQPSRFFSSDVAIRRFLDYVHYLNSVKSSFVRRKNSDFLRLTMEYVNSLVEVSWKGQWMHDARECGRIKRFLKYRVLARFFQKNRLTKRWYLHSMYFSIKPDGFLTKTIQYIRSLLNLDKIKEGFVVLNQSVPANNPQKSQRYFGDNSKIIIVDRDPRDLYILFKKYCHVDWIPTDSVKDFALYYKKCRLAYQQNDSILRVKFEDLIFNYDAEKMKILTFCGIDIEKHVKKMVFFNPEVSANNVMLFRDEKDLLEDIKYIETNLSDFLYDFPENYQKQSKKVLLWLHKK